MGEKYEYRKNKCNIYVGDKVGVLELYKVGKKVSTFDITVKESIEKANNKLNSWLKAGAKKIISIGLAGSLAVGGFPVMRCIYL